jgi:hypothetical protein
MPVVRGHQGKQRRCDGRRGGHRRRTGRVIVEGALEPFRNFQRIIGHALAQHDMLVHDPIVSVEKRGDTFDAQALRRFEHFAMLGLLLHRSAGRNVAVFVFALSRRHLANAKARHRRIMIEHQAALGGLLQSSLHRFAGNAQCLRGVRLIVIMVLVCGDPLAQ